MPVEVEADNVFVVIIHALFKRTNPDNTLVILVHGIDAVLTQALFIGGIGEQEGNPLLFFMDQVDAPMIRRHPDHAFVVLHDAPHDAGL